jgi:hypothetical protein
VSADRKRGNAESSHRGQTQNLVRRLSFRSQFILLLEYLLLQCLLPGLFLFSTASRINILTRYELQKKHWLEHKSSCKLKTSNVHPNKPEVATFVNGPSSKSVMYVATTMAQSNGTIMQTVQTSAGKKTMPQTMPAHAVFGTVRSQKQVFN